MYAAILREPGAPSPSFHSIFGAPLIERQLTWLAALGVEQVLVEVSSDADGERMLNWLENGPDLGLTIRAVASADIEAALDLMSLDPVSVVITSSALICAPLAPLISALCGGNVVIRPPSPDGTFATCVGVVSGIGEAVEVVWPEGWACQIRDANDASRISARIASGHLPCRDYTTLVS